VFGRRPVVPSPRRGISGTGHLIQNLEWMLWDDAKSPGLIGHDRFDLLKQRVLSTDERSRLARLLVRRSMDVNQGNDAIAQILQRLSEFLAEERETHYERLSQWLEMNLMQHANGRVVREDGTFASNSILRAVAAYLNSLEYWGYGYRWEEVKSDQGDAALLVRSGRGEIRVINRRDVEYIQGKPYRFSIVLRGAHWRFEDHIGHFEIESATAAPSTF
jgi:hypothetical protein